MDIQICNLAPQTTQKALKKYLKHRLAAHGISTSECIKPKGKKYAFVTVHDVRLGQAFLAAHMVPGSLSLGGPLTVRRGNKVPNARVIEGLQQRAHEVAHHVPEPLRMAKIPTLATSCGVCSYDNGFLVFRSEWEDRRLGALVMGGRGLTITTPLYDTDAIDETIVFKIAYNTIEHMITHGEGHTPSLILILSLAPKAYSLGKTNNDILNIIQRSLMAGSGTKSTRVRAADATHAHVFANCLAYRVEFQKADWSDIEKFLSHKDKHMPGTIDWPLSKIRANMSFSAEQDAFSTALAASNLPFSVKFQMQGLVANAILLPAVTTALIPVIGEMLQASGEASVAHALQRFVYEVPWPTPETTAEELGISGLTDKLRKTLEYAKLNPSAEAALAKRHEHLYLVHRATVTPAGVYLTGPTLEPANRVLRLYAPFVGTHFLRVSFKDEDSAPIRYERNVILDKIHNQWFREILERGIQIGGRTFSLLGFSNSSLRDQSCWFMARFIHERQSLDAWGVIQRLGRLEAIHAPARFAARVGQAFTDTPGGALDLASARVVTIDDVKRNGHVFSDGCGTISQALLEKVWTTYKRDCRPTLFQIRYAGAKGMVSLDHRLEGEILCLRPSMTKFQSQHNALEICNAARRPLPFYLNRQLVKILEDRGIPARAFHDLQNSAMSELRVAVSSPDRAATFLDRKDVCKACDLAQLFRKLSGLGVDARRDPFLKCALEHAILTEVRMMKHKTRIPVEAGFTLFGVMDEFDLLQEGEVFCRVKGEVKKGNIAITRSPALHPGDVQLARAVDQPAMSPLRALDNCVVFSSLGQRDLPSMLSGGDLDGDIFNVIFEPTIIPSTTHAPANYDRPTPRNLYRTMGRDDMSNWFLEFMKNDQLARIATAHVQAADLHPTGTLHQDCLTLAALHSTAVDFQKTGLAVDMTNMPKLPKVKPHFMAPDPRLLRNILDQPTGFEDTQFVESDDEEDAEATMNPDGGKVRTLYYRSRKVIGQLYDRIDESQFLAELESMLPTATGRVMAELWDYIQQRAIGIQWTHLMDFAWGIREEYEELLVSLMNQYGHSSRQPITELEVFMGSIIGKGGALPSRHVREEARTMKDHFNEGVQYTISRITHGKDSEAGQVDIALQSSFAQLSLAQMNLHNTSDSRAEALERSMACLAVALEPGQAWAGTGKIDKQLVSFRYVAGMVALKELGNFERRN